MAKSRYNNTKLFRNKDSKRFYTGTFYPQIEKQENDTYIIANGETRLDLLAHQYYGDSTLYWIIAVCNNIQGSLFIEPGTQLCIPNISRVTNIYSSLEILNR